MPDSFITDRGKAEAQRLRELRADPAARLRCARESLMKWMFANFGASHGNVAELGAARESSFYGDQLAGHEIIAAVQYLADRKLVAAESQQQGLRLSADGIDCVTSGVTVSDFLASRSSSGDVYNVVNSQGSVLAARTGL